MENVVFIPVSDELLFDHPERIRGPLIPYTPGMRVTGAASDAKGVDNRKLPESRKLPTTGKPSESHTKEQP